MSQAQHQIEDTATSPAMAPGGGGRAVDVPALSRLSVRELIGELARVEESLRARPVLVAHRDAFIPNPARRVLLRRAEAIVDELAARRCR